MKSCKQEEEQIKASNKNGSTDSILTQYEKWKKEIVSNSKNIRHTQSFSIP